MSVKYLTYEEFGAKGDGVTDDMPAIVACHNSANEQKLPVRTNPLATYYIGGGDLTALIKTDVDFSTSKFIIDDRALERINASIFKVLPDNEPYSIEIKELSHDAKKLDFPHTGNVFVRVYSDDHSIYVRKGPNRNSGRNPSDCFIVDADGNILNDINWDHRSIVEVLAKCADDTPITIRGGIFTTIANQAPSKYTYHSRNFIITRSNVTFKDLTHYVTGELDHGAPYSAFINAQECWNFTAENLLLTPHKTYYTESQIPGELVGMGSYELHLSAVINAKYIGVKQTIDITDRKYWGLMSSSFSHNVLLEGCSMSRFDAHCGVNNVTIRNTALGKGGVNFTGFGKCLVENTTVTAVSFVTLRPDYGSFFDGDIVIRNCKWTPTIPTARHVFAARNSGDHDFGYNCMLANSITVEDFEIVDDNTDLTTNLCLLPNYDAEYAPNKPSAYGTPKQIVISGLRSKSGRAVSVYENPDQYADTEVIYI